MTYTCAVCGTTYGTTLEQTAEANAGGETLWVLEEASMDPSMAVVCDDCAQRGTPGTYTLSQQRHDALAQWLLDALGPRREGTPRP